MCHIFQFFLNFEIKISLITICGFGMDVNEMCILVSTNRPSIGQVVLEMDTEI